MKVISIPDAILREIADEALDVFRSVAKHFAKDGWKVRYLSSPWHDAPYRPSIIALKAELYVLVEAQGDLMYHKTLRDYAAWLAARRHYAELFIATHLEGTTQGSTLAQIQADGVGWLVVDSAGGVTESVRPRNAALVVTPEPTLRYGDCKDEVSEAVKKFNCVNRKDGLRDMCEIVERETEDLALIAVRKNLLRMNEQAIKNKDWSGQIDTLASPNAYVQGSNPIIAANFRADLHSFRGARNLVDHKVSNKRDDRRRQIQFAERMMQGPRLVAELVSLKRKVK